MNKFNKVSIRVCANCGAIKPTVGEAFSCGEYCRHCLHYGDKIVERDLDDASLRLIEEAQDLANSLAETGASCSFRDEHPALTDGMPRAYMRNCIAGIIVNISNLLTLPDENDENEEGRHV